MYIYKTGILFILLLFVLNNCRSHNPMQGSQLTDILTPLASGETPLPFAPRSKKFKLLNGKTVFSLEIPEAKPLKIVLGNLPEGSDVLLGYADWPAGKWVDNKGKSQVALELSPENKKGTIWIQVNFRGGISAGNWSGQKLTSDGPYYTFRGDSERPEEINGIPVKPPLVLSLETQYLDEENSSPVSAEVVHSGPQVFKAPWTSISFTYPASWYRGDGEEETTLMVGEASDLSPAKISVVTLPHRESCVKSMMEDLKTWEVMKSSLILSNHTQVEGAITPYYLVGFQIQINPDEEVATYYNASFFIPEKNSQECRQVDLLFKREYLQKNPNFISNFVTSLNRQGGEL